MISQSANDSPKQATAQISSTASSNQPSSNAWPFPQCPSTTDPLAATLKTKAQSSTPKPEINKKAVLYHLFRSKNEQSSKARQILRLLRLSR